MRIGSLFSGIGGLELGLEWSGLGHTVWQVEQNPYCLEVLARHWPQAERFTDVRAVGSHNLAPVDLICGGFPCQDVSSAGSGAGLSGARSGLWYEFARILEELYPTFVVVENVASGAKRWVDDVRRDLGRIGYETLPIPISAADLGAPHERARIFLLGIATHSHVQERSPPENGLQRSEQSKALLTAVRAQTAHADGRRELQPQGSQQDFRRRTGDGHSGWAVEPGVARVVHGLPDRPHREKALGNSVVPQCAEVVGYVLQQLFD